MWNLLPTYGTAVKLKMEFTQETIPKAEAFLCAQLALMCLPLIRTSERILSMPCLLLSGKRGRATYSSTTGSLLSGCISSHLQEPCISNPSYQQLLPEVRRRRNVFSHYPWAPEKKEGESKQSPKESKTD